MKRLLLAFGLASAFLAAQPPARQISLAGEWRFRLDPADKGIDERWQASDLPEKIPLPGATDEHQRGTKNEKIEPRRLTRAWEYVGPAWYQRDIEIPAEWEGKRIFVFLERCHWESQLWLDDEHIGLQNSLVAPHIHELGLQVKPGKHRLTLRVDNRLKINVGPWASAVTEEGPGNWNGVVGRIELQMTEPVWIDALRVFTEVTNKSLRVQLRIRNLSAKPAQAELTLRAAPRGGPAPPAEMKSQVEISARPESSVEAPLSLGSAVQLWDESTPALYDLTASLGPDEVQTLFGMRVWSKKGTQFMLNGRTILLRGNVDNGAFPLKGYPPMDAEAWKQRLKTYQDYGFNHVRFHSWCPPEAAFAAADELGMLLQVENPIWIGDGRISADSARADFIRAEANRIVDTYGNHPSFALMSMGNELGSGLDPFLYALVEQLQKKDPRRFYTSTSAPDNILRPDDYFVSAGPQWKHLRGDPRLEQNSPNTNFDYREYLAGLDRPTIAHEIGQWTVYPDLNEGRKYTGSQQPRYFELYRQSAEKYNLAGQLDSFRAASGKHMVSLYKEEIESILRTPGIAGFQLLALADWPGFGPAFTGVLDALNDSRDLITPASYRRFNNSTVVLLKMSKREWTAAETFSADVLVADYSPDVPGRGGAEWVVRTKAGQKIASGALPPSNSPVGGLRPFGAIQLPLSRLRAPAQYSIEVSAEGASNDWDFWVYPAKLPPLQTRGLLVTKTWDGEARAALKSGRKVVFLAPAADLALTVPVSFTTSFWSPLWFPNRSETMGILCDPKHPALAAFPTEPHSGWQWWHMMSRGRALILNDAPAALRPIVQVIDNPARNYRLGALFEARIGKGRLLVCTFDLETSLDSRLAARQLRDSLLRYAASNRFNPPEELDIEFLDKLFTPERRTPQ